MAETRTTFNDHGARVTVLVGDQGAQGPQGAIGPQGAPGSGSALTGPSTVDLTDTWTVDNGSGGSIAADAGAYYVFGGVVPEHVINVGDDQATIQAVFDAAVHTPDTGDTATVVGDWSKFAVTFSRARDGIGFGVYTLTPLTAEGSPVPDPVATHTKIGHGAYKNGTAPYDQYLGKVDANGHTTFDPAAEDKSDAVSITRNWLAASDRLTQTTESSFATVYEEDTVQGGSTGVARNVLHAADRTFAHQSTAKMEAKASRDGTLAEATLNLTDHPDGEPGVHLAYSEQDGSGVTIAATAGQTAPPLKITTDRGVTLFQVNEDGTAIMPGAASGAYHLFATDITPFQNFPAGVDQIVLYRDMMAGYPAGAGISLDGDDATFRLAFAGSYLIKVRFDVQPAHGADSLTLNMVNQTNHIVTDAFPTPVALRAGVDENPIFVFTTLVNADATFQIQATLGGNTSPEEVGDGTVTILRLV